MLDWIKRWLVTPLQPKKSELEIMLEHMDRQNERQMKIIERQAGTLDRIVAGRFDRPQIAQERTISMPKQFTPDDLADILSELDDDRFLSRVDEVVQ